MRLPDDKLPRSWVEGKQRARVLKYLPGEEHLRVQVEIIEDEVAESEEIDALVRSVKGLDRSVKLNKGIPPEMLLTVAAIEELGVLPTLSWRTSASSMTTDRGSWSTRLFRPVWRASSGSYRAKSRSCRSRRRSSLA